MAADDEQSDLRLRANRHVYNSSSVHEGELVHMRAVARAVDAPVDARTGRRALTHPNDALDLAS
jgi:hypothetical protein